MVFHAFSDPFPAFPFWLRCFAPRHKFSRIKAGSSGIVVCRVSFVWLRSNVCRDDSRP